MNNHDNFMERITGLYGKPDEDYYCYESAEAAGELLRVQTAKWYNPQVKLLSRYVESGGYDCMTDAIYVGPAVIDLSSFGQSTHAPPTQEMVAAATAFADRLVSAVNSHEKLVAALRAARAYIVKEGQCCDPECCGANPVCENDMLAQIDAVLEALE